MIPEEIKAKNEIRIRDQQIEVLTRELRRLQRSNLKLRMHMQVIVMHPVGLAQSILSRRYTGQNITKRLQISSLN